MNDANATRDSVVIERSFDKPVQLVWKMWTDPQHFRAWYGPDGATIPEVDMDVRVGGSRRVCMEMNTPSGPMTTWFTGEFLEVVENKRLVYTDSMCDAAGNIMSAEDMGMPDGHPTTTQIIVELEEVDGSTKMVMTHVGVPTGSPGAVGWTIALDKLAGHLVEAAAE